MKSILYIAVSIALTFFSSILYSQVPEGGVQLNATSGTTWQRIGNCTVNEVSVTNQIFTEALHIAVGKDINNTWDAQVKFPAVGGIETGDIVLVAFYARTLDSGEETGEGKVTVVIENNTSYAKEISYAITIGNEWKQYYASAEIVNALTTSQVSYLFHCGYPDQVIEVADVKYLNYKQTLTLEDLPVTEITYYGQDPDAEWRIEAAARIENHRKGRADFEIYDAAGNPVNGAELTVEMEQHKFGFGTAIAASEFISNDTYRGKVLEMFNEVVFENDLKWRSFNPASTSNIDRSLDTLDAYHIPVRGHNVIWPSWRFMPDFTQDLADNPQALRNAIDYRFDQVMNHTKGRLNDWDIMNEPYSEHDVQDILGNEIMAHWFDKAREIDRNVKLYINDYWIISGGGKNQVKQDYYYNLVQEIEAQGGQVDGIGIQGHMSTELTSITKVYEILDRFATLGKEIKITEHDINLDQRAVQVEYTRDFLTICFSHPAVKSFLVWGFWANRHWEPEAAFFESDWTIRPHGEVWNDLIYNQWWTAQTALTSDATGACALEGFLGTYKYTLKVGDEVREGEFSLDHSFASSQQNRIIIALDETIPEEVAIRSSIEGFLCAGETTMLSVPEGEGVTYTWYKDDVVMEGSSFEISVAEAGSYSVMLTKSGITLMSEPFIVDVRELPEALLSDAGDLVACGGETLLLEGNYSSDLNYSWKKNGMQFQADTNRIELTEAGIYTLSTSKNGCVNTSGEATAVFADNPPSTIYPSGDPSFCEGEDFSLMGTVGSGLTYTWYKDGEVLGLTDMVIPVTVSGTYSLESSNGSCSSVSDDLVVIINPNPVAEIISFSGDSAICIGESIVLSANDGVDEYIWKKGSTVLSGTERSITISEEGSYSVTTFSDTGCETISEPVIVSYLSATDPHCLYSVKTGYREEFSCYPNPFKNDFTISLGRACSQQERIKIYDAMGRLLKVLDILPGENEVQVFGLGSGMFIVEMNDESRYLLQGI